MNRPNQPLERRTTFSTDLRYRYTLWREFEPLLHPGCPYVQFIGLNPSTADATQDDPTIRRCIGFTKAWGFNALCMTNLFAFRATDPHVMMAELEPVGERHDPPWFNLNNHWLHTVACEAALVVSCWGCHGGFHGRSAVVRELLGKFKLHHLGLTKEGHPRHPLYLRADTKPIAWT